MGQLNPFEERTFKYVLTSHAPDIYTISMQNVLYSDSQGVRYATRCSDDHFIVVRSDLLKEFVYEVREHIDDLYIDDAEKKNLSEMIESLDDSIDVSGYEVYKEAETEAVIQIIRDLIEKIASKKEIRVVEKVYEEGKRDSKLTGYDPRKLLVFSSQGIPFFAINLSKGYEPEFFALKTNIDKRFNHVNIKQAVVTSSSYTLDHSIDFSDIKYDEQYGKNFFSQWLNIVFTRLDKEYLTWRKLNEKIGDTYGGPMSYFSGFYSKYNGDNPSLESGTTAHYSLLDRDNSQSFYISFEADWKSNFKEIFGELVKENKDLSFLTGTDRKTRKRIYNDHQLAYYLQKSDTSRVSRYIALNKRVQDDKSLDDIMVRTKEIWDFLCLSHSLDLLDTEVFSGQKYIDELKEFIKKLFEKGFALRQNARNTDMLDIYPLRLFKPHTATERDCIGFIKKNYSSWQIFLDFFEDSVDEAIFPHLSLISSNAVVDKVRWVKSDIQNEEQLEVIMNAILKQAEVYQPSKLATWPKNLQKEMILNHGQTDSGFFILLKNILNGKTKYEEILEDFKAMNIEMDLDRTLQRNEQFEELAGYQAPLIIGGNEEEKTIGCNELLEETLQLMLDENSTFSYLEEGSPAFLRIQASQIVKKYDFLNHLAPSPRGHIWRGFQKLKSKYFKSGGFTVTPSKDKTVEFAIHFGDCKKDFEPLLEKTFESLKGKLDGALSLQHTGRKDQNIMLAYTYDYNDFNAEIEKIQDLCVMFFTEATQLVEEFRTK